MDWEVKCSKCNLYYPITDVFQYNNGYYCKKCYKQVRGLQSDASVDVKCKVCGRTIPPGETRVKDGHVYCTLCYVKSFSPPVRDEVVEEFSKRQCEVCGKVLTRYDDKVQDAGKFYCKPCYRKAESATAYGVVSQFGFLPHSPRTTVSNAAVLFECTSCGMILTPDKLREDKDGRIICPKCGSVLPIKIRGAEKAKNVKDVDYAPTAQLFKCLGDPCRVKIIELLSQNELCVYEVVEMTGFQYSAISYHLKILRGLGLVRSTEKGNFMVYSLTEKGSTIHEFVEKAMQKNP